MGESALRAVKGAAGAPEDDPLRVEGISGATIASNAISKLIQFWLGEHGHGPLLQRLRGGESS